MSQMGGPYGPPPSSAPPPPARGYAVLPPGPQIGSPAPVMIRQTPIDRPPRVGVPTKRPPPGVPPMPTPGRGPQHLPTGAHQQRKKRKMGDKIIPTQVDLRALMQGSRSEEG